MVKYNEESFNEVTIILPIIFNYNQLEDSQHWYEKLKKDKFENIILSDNGSRKTERSIHTNFSVEENIFFGGIARVCLDYCLKNYNFDYIWICNTSGKLIDQINYYYQFKQCIETFGKDNVGIISPALQSKEIDDVKPFHEYKPKSKMPYTIVDFIEGISIIIKKELLEYTCSHGTAYFNKNLKRGWGQDYEICLSSLKNNYMNIILSHVPILFRRNFGYKENKRSELLSNYYQKAGDELLNYIESRYINVSLYLKIIYFYKLNYLLSKSKGLRCFFIYSKYNVFKKYRRQLNAFKESKIHFQNFSQPISSEDRIFCACLVNQGYPIASIKDLKKFHNILLSSTGFYIDYPLFIIKISEIFFKKCFDSSKLGIHVYKIFYQSLFSQIIVLSCKQKVEFFIRCKLKIDRII
ncbi:hypothetical protein DID74_00835 [Candidatus Marinamargulisbacteria bacterium SCGC AG-333-B06]|nr:hypothetical protein DID74_00835 [Candidatus Marinamargulisbacteria bacterium SCGC AG-333-B06]